MQKWYESIASRNWEQVDTLSNKLDNLQLDLPQISPEVRDLLDEEINCKEVETAINEAHEVSPQVPQGRPSRSTNSSFRKSQISLQLQ